MSFGFDEIRRYLLRSSGNLIAYLGSVAIPLVAFSAFCLFSGHRKRPEAPSYILCISVWLTMLVSAFSGLFFLETARIWIFFTPLLCALAAISLADFMNSGKYKRIVGLILAIVISISAIEEILVDNSFGYFNEGW
jgi:hypothetical protein